MKCLLKGTHMGLEMIWNLIDRTQHIFPGNSNKRSVLTFCAEFINKSITCTVYHPWVDSSITIGWHVHAQAKLLLTRQRLVYNVIQCPLFRIVVSF